MKTQENDAIAMFMDKLERLPELVQSELEEISERIRQLRSLKNADKVIPLHIFCI